MTKCSVSKHQPFEGFSSTSGDTLHFKVGLKDKKDNVRMLTDGLNASKNLYKGSKGKGFHTPSKLNFAFQGDLILQGHLAGKPMTLTFEDFRIGQERSPFHKTWWIAHKSCTKTQSKNRGWVFKCTLPGISGNVAFVSLNNDHQFDVYFINRNDNEIVVLP